MIKVECPHCRQHVESYDELVGREVTCPNCHQVFTPQRSIQPNFIAPQEGAQAQALGMLRARSAYPALRSAIDIIAAVGAILLVIAGGLQLISGGDHFWFGAVIIFLAVVWWWLFKPFASLLIDIADACIAISRK